MLLGLRKISILRNTSSVIRFLFFLTLFRATFCDLVRKKNEFRVTFETFRFFFWNAAKLRGSTGGTMRKIIVVVRARKWKIEMGGYVRSWLYWHAGSVNTVKRRVGRILEDWTIRCDLENIKKWLQSWLTFSTKAPAINISPFKT